MSLPVALQLYTVRDEMEADFAGTLKKTKDFGYDGVEFAGLFGKTADEVKSLCETIGLVPISAHVPLDDMVADPDGVLSVYAKIGCKYIAVPYLTEDRRPGTDGWEKTIADIRLVCEKAKELGMTMLYHNHDFEFVKIDGKYALDILYDTIPSGLLQTELDTCWVNVGGENPADYIRKYAGRVPVVHLKDFVKRGQGGKLYELIGIDDDSATAEEEAFSFAPVGSGMQDMPSVLKASEESGAFWVVVEQDRPAKKQTPLESAALSRNYLKNQGW
ncbi:MAG TPA: sugar phosphate isomerase/epimerase [Ruminococcaceae bacterium]|nr:sugar phosphate isomerase/epimerase [Oscillospiraceae bacterium]